MSDTIVLPGSRPLKIRSAAAAVPVAKRVVRLGSIDGLRGFLMLFMALDHAFWYLSAKSYPDEFWGGTFPLFGDGLAFVTRLMSHFCAPGFFFLMGASMVLLQASRQKAGWDDDRITTFFVKRGLLFVAIQFLIENPLWALSFRSSYAEMALYFGVMFGLGSSMALAAFFIRLPSKALLVLAVLGIAASQWLVPHESLFTAEYGLFARVMLIAGQSGPVSVYFPVLPWLSVTLLGIPFGRALRKDSVRAFRLLWVGGFTALAVFAVMRLNTGIGNLRSLPENPDWKNLLTITKYPPSFLFLCLTLGMNSLFLAAWESLSLSGKRIVGVFETLGQAPFFFYVMHLVVFGIVGLLLGRIGHDRNLVYLAWFGGVLLLLPATRWFAAFKQKQIATSFWRLF